MDRIEALNDRPALCGGREDLYIVVNGERLDLLLSAESGLDFRGLLPSWSALAGTGPDVDGLRGFIAERSRLDGADQLLPILFDQDDPGPSAPAVVAEVSPVGAQVHWRRFGLASAEARARSGENVQWLDAPGPFIFDRSQYLDCLEAFKRRPLSAVSRSWVLCRERPFLYRLYAIYGGLIVGIGSGALNLPALAYRQVQSELTESPAPPAWSFVRLLPVNGLLALGLDSSEHYLLVINQNGRELFNLQDGRRKARVMGRQINGRGESAVAEGIGPLAGRLIPLWGRLGRQTPPDLGREARLASNGLSPIVAALSADEGRRLIVAQEDGIYLFNRL